MLIQTGSTSSMGDLREPITPEGRGLLDILDAHLPSIQAGANENDRNGTFPVETFERLNKDGVLSATVPKELGGLGVDCLHDVALALLKVAESDASTALALHMQFSRAYTLNYEWRHGSDAARALAERILRPMGSGDAVVCTTVKDAGGGRIVTKLTPDGGGGWLMSGRKTLASMAPIATDFVISVQIPSTEGNRPPRLAAAVVPRNAPGLTVLDNWDGLGMRASGSVDVVLEECPVAAGNVFLRGFVGEQDDAALAGATVSSITMLGLYTGVVQAARDIAVKTLVKRGSTGAGGTRTLVTEIDARLYSLRATVAAALAVADAPAAGALADPAERGRRMMTSFQYAKLIVNRVAPEIVGDCLVAIGGASYSSAHPLSRLYRDVRAGAFMHPYTYADAVDFLSSQAFPPEQAR